VSIWKQERVLAYLNVVQMLHLEIVPPAQDLAFSRVCKRFHHSPHHPHARTHHRVRFARKSSFPKPNLYSFKKINGIKLNL
jgi:hypothetical protein